MKTLLLMRHAKSDWDADYSTDHERPLNGRGVRSAEIMGRVVAARGLVPDLVITSTAVRARTTAQLAIEAGNWITEIRLEPDLYGTGPAGVIEIAAGAPEVERLMLVGHQPTWSSVVRRITGGFVDMKTGAVAVIEVPVDRWGRLPGAEGVIADVLFPRDFFDSEWDR